MNLAVRVIPGSKLNQIISFEDDLLKIRIKAKALDNQANLAVAKYVSDILDIPKSSVIILRGQHSRNKLLQIPDYLDLKSLITNYEFRQ